MQLLKVQAKNVAKFVRLAMPSFLLQLFVKVWLIDLCCNFVIILPTYLRLAISSKGMRGMQEIRVGNGVWVGVGMWGLGGIGVEM